MCALKRVQSVTRCRWTYLEDRLRLEGHTRTPHEELR
jgi:hypothetical protein